MGMMDMLPKGYYMQCEIKSTLTGAEQEFDIMKAGCCVSLKTKNVERRGHVRVCLKNLSKKIDENANFFSQDY